MARSLPVRPSLVQLKHQAKDLRSAARDGAPDAIATLRRLKRLASASADSIARERVTLSEAQFALALEYGCASWAELRARVEALRGEAEHPLRRADGAVIIQGFEEARWGGGSRRQCSSIATLALVSERSGDDTDYDYLMGASGAAFRAQMSEGKLCPSSPSRRAACCRIPEQRRAWPRSTGSGCVSTFSTTWRKTPRFTRSGPPSSGPT